MTPLIKTNIVQFPKKKTKNILKDPTLHTWVVRPLEWRALGNGKKLSDGALATLWVIKRLTEKDETNNLEINYETLIEQSSLDCSKDRMYRYLKELSNAQIISCEIKKHILIISIPELMVKKLGSVKNIIKQSLKEIRKMNKWLKEGIRNTNQIVEEFNESPF